jgi:hypothetical protein
MESKPLVRVSKTLTVEGSPRNSTGSGVGLPCANCKSYYPADLPECPVCKCSERIRPDTPLQRLRGIRAKPIERENVFENEGGFDTMTRGSESLRSGQEPSWPALK